MRSWIYAVAVGILAVAMATSCDNRPSEPTLPGWQFMGLRDSESLKIALDWPYLYAGGYTSGLYRADVSRAFPSWEHLGFDDQWIEDIEVLGNGAILVGSEVGLNRSEDGGRSWACSDSGMAACEGLCWVPCLAHQNGVVYAGTIERGLYRSDDDGLSWTAITNETELTYLELRCQPGDSGFMLARASTVIDGPIALFSSDRGESWTRINRSALLEEFPLSLAIDPISEGVGYIGLLRGVVKTESVGEAWSPIFQPDEYPSMGSLVHDEMISGHIFMAGNGTLGNTDIYTGIVYESRDGGQSIDAIDTPFIGLISELTYDGDREVLYVAASNGVYRYQLEQ